MPTSLHPKQHSTEQGWHLQLACGDYQGGKWHCSAHSWGAGLAGDREGAEVALKHMKNFNKFSFKATFAATGPGLLQEWGGPWLWASGAALAEPNFLLQVLPSHLQGTHCTRTELGLRRQRGGQPAPCLTPGSPRSPVLVYHGFFAPPQSLQKANLARAERQSKTRHLSSVSGSVTHFLCNCWILACLIFHLYNSSCCHFCLFKGTRWLYGETPVELELWAILLIQIHENPFGAKRYLSTWHYYFYHVGATYCTFNNFWNTEFIW